MDERTQSDIYLLYHSDIGRSNIDWFCPSSDGAIPIPCRIYCCSRIASVCEVQKWNGPITTIFLIAYRYKNYLAPIKGISRGTTPSVSQVFAEAWNDPPSGIIKNIKCILDISLSRINNNFKIASTIIADRVFKRLNRVPARLEPPKYEADQFHAHIYAVVFVVFCRNYHVLHADNLNDIIIILYYVFRIPLCPKEIPAVWCIALKKGMNQCRYQTITGIDGVS